MLSEDKRRFMLWLLTPPPERDPRKMHEMAAELGVTRQTLLNWRKDEEFLAEWNRLYLEKISSPETKSSIMATLARTATDPDDPKHVQAAKAYFEIEGSLRPKGSVDVKVQTTPVSNLSDDQLEALLALKAGDELARRREAS